MDDPAGQGGPTPAWQPQSPAPPPPVNVNVAGPTLVVQRQQTGPSILVRAVWFLFIGWWLRLIATGIAYLLCLTIVGLPLGFALFNRLPAVLTLRPRSDHMVTEVRDGVTYVRGGTTPQLPMWVRALWFVFVGWWVGAIYLGIAWFLTVILITMPIGLFMFNRVGAVMTLLRY